MKRAQLSTRKELGAWIIFGVVLFILIIIAVKSLIWMGTARDVEKCRTSVLAKSYTRPGGTESPFPLYCKTRMVDIREDAVYLYNRKTKEFEKQDFPKYKGSLDFDIKAGIAEEMRLCWYQFLEGTVIPFKQSFFIGDIGYCVVCSEINFDDKLKEKIGANKVANFIDWLEQTKIPRSDYTYFSYLSNKRTRATHPFAFIYLRESFDTLETLDEFSLDESYDIVFYLYTPAWLETVGKKTGVGYEEQKAILALTETENVAKLNCDKLF